MHVADWRESYSQASQETWEAEPKTELPTSTVPWKPTTDNALQSEMLRLAQFTALSLSHTTLIFKIATHLKRSNVKYQKPFRNKYFSSFIYTVHYPHIVSLYFPHHHIIFLLAYKACKIFVIFSWIYQKHSHL